MADDFSELKRREEAKRDAHWDPVERWRLIQEMIAWADAQCPVSRNSPERCLELQRAKLAWQDDAPQSHASDAT